MTPVERYQADLQQKNYVSDSAQLYAVQQTQRLYDALLNPPANNLWQQLRQRWAGKQPVRGLYFWGGIGRGKTYLVDNFYHALPFSDKMRLHFHRFMQTIHAELKTLGHVTNPLNIVGQRLAAKTRVLCLDEFHVSDVTDAMLLAGLLDALFRQGVTLVATSNLAPDELYKYGVQRERFVPAIELIKTHTDVVNLDGGMDYRLRTLEQADIYFSPLDDKADEKMRAYFFQLAPDEGKSGKVLEIHGRKIVTERCADGVVWLTFEALCNIPRAVADYIELARCYNTVLLSGVPILEDSGDARALRLINLVDEFYDRGVKLIVSAAAPPEHLYIGTHLAFQFQRTISRLREMGSHDYLKRPHQP